MMWQKTLAIGLAGCILAFPSPLASADHHDKKTKTRFEILMGDCKQAKHRARDLRPIDRADLQVLSDAYKKAIPFLKEKPLHHIPHQMHLIWIGPDPFPKKSIVNVQSFRKHHPDWIMNFWTDLPDRKTPIPGMKKRLVEPKYFQPIFDLYLRSTNYGEKADLLRFVILYREGGLYFDHDALCTKSLEPFADHFDLVTACERMQYHDGINTYITPAIGLFLCRPGHPVMQKSWELARQRWDIVPAYSHDEAWRSVIFRTFDSFAKASKDLLNSNGNRDLILPTAYFYPNLAFKKSFVKKLQKAGYVYSFHGIKKTWRKEFRVPK